MVKVAICAPGKRLELERADAVRDMVADDPDIELHFHEQCFARHGHFAGDDATRLGAFLDCANDPEFDAVWFAMGGYGANRIAAGAIAGMKDAAKTKTFLGYSDTGYLLAALYRAGIGRPVHGPMVGDIKRDGGEKAVGRSLDWLKGGGVGLEPTLGGQPHVAFNLTTLAMLVGTDLMPDLTGHVVMVEEVSEHLYAVDRLFFHISQHLAGVAGIKLGRISDVPENDRPFGSNPEEIARYWCGKSGIPYLGFADIGHDAANTIVPFGLAGSVTGA
ncbi:LD-carboxypeptidase [Pontixanthobacter aquaemixtae]|uniref:LD-carboxypeptidase n=1 Tax=Pontixanthobacter aquaemixtae TaxID=1958940 RepID=A0A844ZYE0_9SPHN|nr:LD-carboxypeptidase [Pontixanthobacter aquaemixtae]MXO90489.1 LD-carboxypeptidase [Pontixanthobacter aquaemixtae]